MRLDGLGLVLGFFLIALAATLGYLSGQWLAPKIGLRSY